MVQIGNVPIDLNSMLPCLLAPFVLGVFAVTFRMIRHRPRGRDLEYTLQVKDVEAPDAQTAMKKAYRTLSAQQQQEVQGVFLKRTDKE
jgi:hypothetical protein